MALVDDVNVRWPDAVLPGSAAVRHFLEQRRAREEDDRRGEDEPES